MPQRSYRSKWRSPCILEHLVSSKYKFAKLVEVLEALKLRFNPQNPYSIISKNEKDI